MAKLFVLPAARADLIDIGAFIALDNPPRTASFEAEIEAKIVEIGERPGSFQKRHDLHPGLRHARHGRYLIFFIEKDGEVQIVRVLQGSRDLPRLLGLQDAQTVHPSGRVRKTSLSQVRPKSRSISASFSST